MDMKLRFCTLFVVFSLIVGRSYSQTHLLSGTVVDGQTQEPLYNTSIYNKGLHRGTRTDSTGRFRIAGSPGHSALVVSMIGYTPQTLTPGQDTLTVTLLPAAEKMTQVVVTNKHGKYRNKDNPAVELIRKVIANKENNRPESFDFASYEEYDKLEISLRDIDSAKLNKKLFR